MIYTHHKHFINLEISMFRIAVFYVVYSSSLDVSPLTRVPCCLSHTNHAHHVPSTMSSLYLFKVVPEHQNFPSSHMLNSSGFMNEFPLFPPQNVNIVSNTP